MVPRDRVNVAAAASVGTAERLVQRPILNKTCEKKVPKKIHKSEREKHKRDKQNDLFSELGTILEPDRQNNGKACILGDTTRILKDLLSQVESLRKENSALKNESHYVALERNELHDDNSMLRNEILELQLFPEAASTEDSELSLDYEISNNVTRPQKRYPTPMATLPVNRFPTLLRMGDEQQCSSGTTGTSEEDGLGRA